MANVPYTPYPTVQNQVVPTPTYNVQATPDMFGAGVAQAEYNAGSAMIQGGKEIFNAAVKFGDMMDEARAREALNKANAQANELLYHPETGYYAQYGKGAVDNYGDVQAKLRETYSGLRSGLTASQQRYFDQHGVGHFQSALNGIGTHAAGEGKRYAHEQLQGTILGAQQSAALNPEPGNVTNQALIAREAKARSLAGMGITGADAEPFLFKVQSETIAGAIARVAAMPTYNGRPGILAARDMLEQHKGNLDGQHFDALAGHIYGQARTYDGRALTAEAQAELAGTSTQRIMQGTRPTTPVSSTAVGNYSEALQKVAMPRRAGIEPKPLEAISPSIMTAAETAAKQHGIPLELLLATAHVEGGLRPEGHKGGAGEIGVMQIMPDEARELNARYGTNYNVESLEGNINLGALRYKKALELGVAPTYGDLSHAYNRGEGSWQALTQRGEKLSTVGPIALTHYPTVDYLAHGYKQQLDQKSGAGPQNAPASTSNATVGVPESRPVAPSSGAPAAGPQGSFTVPPPAPAAQFLPPRESFIPRWQAKFEAANYDPIQARALAEKAYDDYAKSLNDARRDFQQEVTDKLAAEMDPSRVHNMNSEYTNPPVPKPGILTQEEYQQNVLEPWQRAQQVSGFIRAIPLATPEVLQAMEDELRSAMSDPTRTDYAENRKRLTAFQQARELWGKYVERDKAGAFMAADEHTGRMFAAGHEALRSGKVDVARNNFTSAFARLDQDQADHGISLGDRRLLPSGVAAEMAESINKADLSKTSILATMNSWEKAFGDYYPRILSELGAAGLDARLTAIPFMGSNVRLRQDVTNGVQFAMANKDKDWRTLIGDKEFSQVSDAVRAQIAPFITTVGTNQAGLTAAKNVTEALIAASCARVSAGGTRGDGVGTTAAEEVVKSFFEGYTIPKDQGHYQVIVPREYSSKADYIPSQGANIVSNLRTEDIDMSRISSGFDTDKPEAIRASIGAYYVWKTNASMTGMTLWVQTRNAYSPVIVKAHDNPVLGRRVEAGMLEVSFAELERNAHTLTGK